MSDANPIRLRPLTRSDLPVLVANQLDPDANRMVAHSRDNTDRTQVEAHWLSILDRDDVILRGVEWNGQLAGYLIAFEHGGLPEVGYWLGRDYWGRGLASHGLRLFLCELPQRPLHAWAAKDNLASLRVLEKCGFVRYGESQHFSPARGADIIGYRLRLD